MRSKEGFLLKRLLVVIGLLFIIVPVAFSYLNKFEILSALPFADEIWGLWNDVNQLEGLQGSASIQQHIVTETMKSIFVAIVSFLLSWIVGRFMGYSTTDSASFSYKLERGIKYALCDFISFVGAAVLFQKLLQENKIDVILAIGGIVLIADVLIAALGSRSAFSPRPFTHAMIRILVWEPIKTVATSMIIFGLITIFGATELTVPIMITLIIMSGIEMMLSGRL